MVSHHCWVFSLKAVDLINKAMKFMPSLGLLSQENKMLLFTFFSINKYLPLFPWKFLKMQEITFFFM